MRRRATRDGASISTTPSNVSNDENMLVVRGDDRVADIYLTEFMRLFQHFYFRYMSSDESTRRSNRERLYFR